jgi:hypothetical protein
MNEVIKKNGIKFGILLGLAGILSQLVIYLSGGTELIATVTGVVFWVIYLVIRIFQLIYTKKELNNTITFKEAFTTLFICILNGILISQLFTYLLMNHIDIEYGKNLNEFMITKQVEASKLLGAKSSDLKEIASMDNFSISNLLKGTAMSLIISSIMNLILAAIFKSKSTNSPFNE